MISDSAEATVKSLAKPTPKRIEDIVAGTIRQKRDDGQFDECELTMRELNEVSEAVVEALIGFLGPRIEYPTGPAKAMNGTPANGTPTNGKPAVVAEAPADAAPDSAPEAPVDAGPDAGGTPDPVPDPAGKPT